MISNETQIKNRIKVHRNVLASELDPGILLSALTQCKSFPQNVLDALPIGSCERVEAILAFVENGSDDVVNEFVRALHDLSFDGMVELIDPSIAKSKAGMLFLISIKIINICIKISISFNVLIF